ncbi:hypothetical protein NTCA1_01640 [Novosphingobium sp. TCA1]|nr:hypothetical protein NTCA1_01640 [Novosphingobium sp. TCA1]
MGMRAHVEAFAAAEHRLAHLVEEDEGTDHAALRGRQRAADLEAVTEIADGGKNDEVYAFDIG